MEEMGDVLAESVPCITMAMHGKHTRVHEIVVLVNDKREENNKGDCSTPFAMARGQVGSMLLGGQGNINEGTCPSLTTASSGLGT